MKKPVVKVLSVILCAAPALGGMAYAMGTAASASAPSATAPAPTPATGGAKAAGSPHDSGTERNVKDETVYVLAHADGSVEKIIVSDWVKNTRGDSSLNDVTTLTDIENVKGDETFTLGGDDSCVWDAKGNDIYYQGSVDKKLPVSVAVSYTLDGQSIDPGHLAGKSGRVTIRFDYANNQYEMVDIGGRQEKIYVPFTMLTGLLLDNGVFTNVSVSNGKIVNDGDRTIVAGLAFPGLQESLGLDRDTIDLPGYVEVTADVEGFSLDTTVTLAANELFNDAASELDGSGKTGNSDELDGKLDEMTDAMAQPIDGSSQLYDGLCTLLDRSQELVAGIDQLAAGAAQLKQGAGSLSTGAGQLYNGVLTMKNGSAALIDGVTQLRDGAMELTDGLKEFNDQGVQKLVDAVDGDLSGLMDRVDALREVSERYNSFSGISGEMDGQVKFIWRTEAVDAED